MTKTELVRAIAKANKITNTRAQMELDSILEIIMDAVCGGDEVNIKGFGKFYSKQYRAKSCINPSTGDKMEIPAHIGCNFTCGKNFKERMNEK
jgi:nucleoid DNA-binding protein